MSFQSSDTFLLGFAERKGNVRSYSGERKADLQTKQSGS